MKIKEAKQAAKQNLRLFICFRMLFNARFYYPVYALLFLEHGLSWEDFGILNGIWAITIILLEVPSGALADTFWHSVEPASTNTFFPSRLRFFILIVELMPRKLQSLGDL